MQPSFSWSALLGLALPSLFVINMTSQKFARYRHDQKLWIYHPRQSISGLDRYCTYDFRPFGCFSINLAAISAAVSLDDQVHPDPSKRYIAGISCGLFYILMGFLLQP